MKINVSKYLRKSWVLVIVTLVFLILNEIVSLPDKIIFDRDNTSGNAAETAATGETTGLEEEGEAGTTIAGEESEAESSRTVIKYSDGEIDSITKKMLSDMSLDEKIAQMFIITPEALVGQESDFTVVSDSDRKALEEYPVGGFIFFSRNLKDSDQVEALLDDLQSSSQIPLFLSVDEEGGTVARVADSNLFDVQKFSDMGTVQSETEAEEIGQTIGNYLSRIGFNLDFAPVADVNSNPDNTVIGSRAFSSDYDTASGLVAACVKGFKETDTLCTLKHFPGHGNTSQDSHTDTATTNKTLSELEQDEFKPFQAGIEAGADLVMVGHITAVNVDDVPASFSEVLISGVLRGKLGYDGLVITDALNMGAVTELYSSGDAAIAAVKAGCDLLLMPENFKEAYNALIDAVKTDKITEDRINQSVTRILKKKIESGIISGYEE